MYEVYLKDKTKLRVSDKVGNGLEYALTAGDLSGFFKCKYGTFSVKSIKHIRKLKNVGDTVRERINNSLIKVNSFNKKRAFLDFKKRAEEDIRIRILPGLTEQEKDKLTSVYDGLVDLCVKYFEKNPSMLSCPFSVWGRVISKICDGKLPEYFRIVILNDNAAQRWVSKQGEWESFKEPKAIYLL